MHPADFSHYEEQFYRPHTVAWLQARGEQVTDELLLEILLRIKPPLLSEQQTANVCAVLRRRRGRPPSRGVPSRRWLARQILSVDRADVNRAFLNALADRVLSLNGPTQFQRAVVALRERQKRDRNMFIRGLYRHIYEALKNRPKAIFYEPLGELTVPVNFGTRGDTAAEMTRAIVSDRLKMDPPAISTIRKIASMR